MKKRQSNEKAMVNKAPGRPVGLVLYSLLIIHIINTSNHITNTYTLVKNSYICSRKYKGKTNSPFTTSEQQ